MQVVDIALVVSAYGDMMQHRTRHDDWLSMTLSIDASRCFLGLGFDSGGYCVRFLRVSGDFMLGAVAFLPYLLHHLGNTRIDDLEIARHLRIVERYQR